MATKKKGKKARVKKKVRKRERKKVRKKAKKIKKKVRKKVKEKGRKKRKVKRKRKERIDLTLLENKHIRNLLIEIAGEKALKVLGEMTEPMTDERLANLTKVKVSEVRAILNKLHRARVADYERTRDEETGWYSYTWRLMLDRALDIVRERKRVEKEALRAAREAEKTMDFYACPNCFVRSGVKYPFDRAAEMEFRCPDCFTLLRYVERKRGR